MSRVGRTPVKLPKDVKFNLKDGVVTISGKLGELSYTLQPGIMVEENDGELKVTRDNDSRPVRALHGLTRALLNNMVIGVTNGFVKELQIIGTGYTAERIGPWLRLSVGYSHDILMEVPQDLVVEAVLIPRRDQGSLGVQAEIKVTGINKEDVGKFAAEIKRCRPPLNYATGKGIRYKGEYVRIKPGKAGASS
ncbi:MAG TPA: 50S ribosomal protein L6 [Candidatus Cloacimonadota bacterium]|nr:50S ribosomal protein L6 [Candidatus Cloacimonadota bacterium]